MTRMTLASTTLISLLAVGSAFAQTTPPPKTTPPAGQTTTPPAGQQTTPPPVVPKPAPAPFPPDSKIAVVNLQIVVATSKLGKAGQDQMKKLGDSKTAEQQALTKKVQDLQAQLQSQAGVLSAAAQAQKSSDLDKAQRDLQHFQDDAQAQIKELNDSLLDNFQDKVIPIVEELAKEKGLYLVLSLQDSAPLLYVHPGLDLSDEVVKRLDAKYPATAGK